MSDSARTDSPAIAEPVPMQPDDKWIGTVVVAINAHGVAVAYGPYSEMDAHDIATFLAPVCLGAWVFVLDEHGQARYFGPQSPAKAVLRPASPPPDAKDSDG